MLISNLGELGAIIRRLRTDRGLTQSQLAEQAKVSRFWIVQIESGQIDNPQVQQIMRTVTALGFSLSIEPTPQPGSVLDDIVESHLG